MTMTTVNNTHHYHVKFGVNLIFDFIAANDKAAKRKVRHTIGKHTKCILEVRRPSGLWQLVA